MTVKTILTGHVSPETAYIVTDYPYGRTLRCQMRYWLDCDSKKGARLMRQSTKPKKAGIVWNKPHASTYCVIAGCMYLDENEHVQWSGLHEYMNDADTFAWPEIYAAGVPDLLVPKMNYWIKAKRAYAARKAV